MTSTQPQGTSGTKRVLPLDQVVPQPFVMSPITEASLSFVLERQRKKFFGGFADAMSFCWSRTCSAWARSDMSFVSIDASKHRFDILTRTGGFRNKGKHE
jgi:hypothetical protein